MNNLNHEDIFTSIYENCLWGDNNRLEYKGSSGSGSEIELLKTFYIPFLRNFISLNNIKSIVDLGCGDFKFGELVYDNIKNIKYTGIDVYKKLIDFNNKKYINNKKYNFIHLDFLNSRESIMDTDLYIIKDIFQHWDNTSVSLILDFLVKNKKFKYILITNSYTPFYDVLAKNIKNSKNLIENMDINIGDFRQVSAQFSPLKEFNPLILFRWGSDVKYYEWLDKWYLCQFETSLIIKNT